MPFQGLSPVGLKNSFEVLDTALEERDRYTRDHCNRLVILSEETGRLCGLDGHGLQNLKRAALFHDIGKIGIPDSILQKPGRLDDDEWEVIKTHSEKGERIINILKIGKEMDFSRLIRSHHEHFNGRGYPDGLSGEDIPVGARILSVVDSYDAMTTTRSYANARTHCEALSIMHEEEGEKNDPYIFRKFLEVVGDGGKKGAPPFP